MIAAMRIRQERFGAIRDPLDRAPHALGRPQADHLFRVDIDLGPESAADIRRDHPKFVFRRNCV